MLSLMAIDWFMHRQLLKNFISLKLSNIHAHVIVVFVD